MNFRLAWVYLSICLTLPPSLQARKSDDYFITQYRSYANVRGSDANSDCGPATLAMVALAYGKQPPDLDPRDRQGLIDHCKAAMVEGSELREQGTSTSQLLRGAARLGIQTRLLDSLEAIDAELGQGRLVAAAGNVIRLQFPCRGHGGHCLLIVASDEEGYRVHDPGGYFRQPGSLMTRQQMRDFLWHGVAFWIEN